MLLEMKKIEVERENKMLLSKIFNIMQSPSKFFCLKANKILIYKILMKIKEFYL